MFELFSNQNINQNLIEYSNVKKKAKKWGRIFGILGLITDVGIFFLMLAGGIEFNVGIFALVVLMSVAIWISYVQLGKCYAWGWYWDEKRGHDTFFIAMFFAGIIGFALRMKYRKFDKKLKKKLKNASAEFEKNENLKIQTNNNNKRREIMFCEKCGKEISNGAKFCSGCGSAVESVADTDQSYNVENNAQTDAGIPIQHDVPQCTCCGHIGPWKVGPVLRPMDFVIGIAFAFLGVFPGLIYLGVVAAIRINEKNREKICTKCNAKNLFTFRY